MLHPLHPSAKSIYVFHVLLNNCYLNPFVYPVAFRYYYLYSIAYLLLIFCCLQLDTKIDVTRELFQRCLVFTMLHRIAPLWNRVGDHLVQGFSLFFICFGCTHLLFHIHHLFHFIIVADLQILLALLACVSLWQNALKFCPKVEFAAQQHYFYTLCWLMTRCYKQIPGKPYL